MKTIREIKRRITGGVGNREREKLLELYREDTRSGVVSLVKKIRPGKRTAGERKTAD